MIALTFADLDYLGLAVVQVVDRATGEILQDQGVRPLGCGGGGGASWSGWKKAVEG